MDVELWSLTADVQHGACLASGSFEVDWKNWRQGQVERQTINLEGRKQVRK